MAKLTGPLFSLSASGQLAKSLVYMKWKGIDDVRKYVIPANPKSDDQMTQRGIFENAVDEWHAAIYSGGDVTAWNLLASISAKVMSGFNRMIQEFVIEKILGNVWTRMSKVNAGGTTSTSFNADLTKVSGGLAPYIRYGTSKLAMKSSKILTDVGGDTWNVDGGVTGLIADTVYYFTFDVGVSAATWGRLGIYRIKTLAA